MNSAINAFIQYWHRFDDQQNPLVHPDDKEFVSQADFELKLLPLPINGNLAEAECIILVLNPGLDDEDYEWEKNEGFRRGLVRNILQNHRSTDTPLLYLDPAFEQHPGAGYWARSRIPKRQRREQQKLSSVINAIAERDGVSLATAQAHIARKVAILQLCPYHSAKMTRRDLLSRLPSSRVARTLVQQLIAMDDKLVVATRAVSEWGFSGPITTSNLVVYPSTLGISASLSLKSEGGMAMVNRISRVGST